MNFFTASLDFYNTNVFRIAKLSAAQQFVGINISYVQVRKEDIHFGYQRWKARKKMTQFESRNITMMMDLYEMTMAYGYFKENDTEKKVAFDVFYRKNPDNAGYAIFAGLEQIIEYIENLHFDEDDIEYLRGHGVFLGKNSLHTLLILSFRGDIYSFPEGTIMYPNEPVVITVVAPLLEAQLVETAILGCRSIIRVTDCYKGKKNRKVQRQGRGVSDFGARRAHNMDAAVYGARAAYIGGAVGTATVRAGQMFGIPVGGTHGTQLGNGSISDESDSF